MLEALEEDVVRDLLVIFFHNEGRARANAPQEAALADLMGDAEAIGELVDRTRNWLERDDTKRALNRVIHGGTPEELEEKRRPRSIRIGGSFSTSKPVTP